MTEEVNVRFHTNGTGNAIAKVRAALKGVGLTAEPLGGDAEPLEGREGIGGNVVVSIFKPAWDAVDEAALRAALEAQGLPGTYEVIGNQAYGYV